MKRDKRHSWLLGSLLAGCICLLTGCSDDTEPSQDGRVLQVAGVTRAADDALSVEEVNTDGTAIQIFLTTNDDTQTAVTTGQFTCNSSGSWNSTVAVKENIQYYVYGYMPAGAATGSVTPHNSDYSQGVDMTLNDLPAIGEKDICVLTGLQQVTSATATKEAWKEKHEGQFGYLAIASNNIAGNYAYLLMDHIYAALKFQFNVNAVYAGLRTIHLKEVTLKTDKSTVNATVLLRNDKGISSVSYSCSGDEKTLGLLTEEDAEVVLLVAPLYTAVGSELYVVPSTDLFDTEGSHASIVCKYDIYDNNVTTEHPNGNLIRKDCTATNKLKFSSGMARGKKKILTLTVNPTYLYMLSEPDLDNPTVTIN